MKIKSAMYTIYVDANDVKEVRDRNGEDSRSDMEIARMLAQTQIWHNAIVFKTYTINFTSVDRVMDIFIVQVGVENKEPG